MHGVGFVPARLAAIAAVLGPVVAAAQRQSASPLARSMATSRSAHWRTYKSGVPCTARRVVGRMDTGPRKQDVAKN